MAKMRQALTIKVQHGRMDTPDQEERLKRLHSQLKYIAQEGGHIDPAPEYKITLDKTGNVYVSLNERMLSYMLIKFGEAEDIGLEAVDLNEPPAWFMALMGNEPYEHLLPPEGAVINPERKSS